MTIGKTVGWQFVVDGLFEGIAAIICLYYYEAAAKYMNLKSRRRINGKDGKNI